MGKLKQASLVFAGLAGGILISLQFSAMADKDVEGMNESYKKMYDAYTNIFTRMGLEFRPVEADNGAIGGGHSHEFTVLADAGESNIAVCTKCDYAASDEKAELKPVEAPAEDELPLEKVSTPGTNTIEALCDFLKVPADKTIKAVAYQTDKDELVLAFIRGDHDVNEVKVINQIANFALLEWPENIAISDDPPSIYVPLIRERFATDEWQRMHDLHALPAGWESMAYADFLDERRRLMARVIRRGFESLA